MKLKLENCFIMLIEYHYKHRKRPSPLVFIYISQVLKHVAVKLIFSVSYPFLSTLHFCLEDVLYLIAC